MCGRYARIGELETWIGPLGVDAGRLQVPRGIEPRYNVAPGTANWIVAMGAGGDLALDEIMWRFPTGRGNRINVRSETAHVVPEYRDPYAHDRCVVLASGFYEPKGSKSEKVRPWFYFQPRDGAPLYLGGIVGAEGFSILTRAPVPPVADVHDRTPVLIPAENVIAWLDPDVPGRVALKRFAPTDAGTLLEGWRVGDAAKRAANDGPELIQAVPDA